MIVYINKRLANKKSTGITKKVNIKQTILFHVSFIRFWYLMYKDEHNLYMITMIFVKFKALNFHQRLD